MNGSEQRLLNRFLEKLRLVYGQTEFMQAYDIASWGHSWLLNNDGLINNKNFSRVAQKEIDKAFRYAKSLSYKTKKEMEK